MFNRKQLARLIWPLIVEQFLAVAIGMADTVMVTSCGEAAVAGVSLVDSINVLLINIFSALATGGAILASQYIGRQDKEQANVAAKQLVLVTAGISVLVMAICLFANASLLHMVFGEAEADVMTNAETYFFWSALSYPFLALYNAGAALFRAMGNSRISMFTALLMNALNIGGNALLIYGMNMGVAGAAIASLGSRFVGAAIMLALLRLRAQQLGEQIPHRKAAQDLRVPLLPALRAEAFVLLLSSDDGCDVDGCLVLSAFVTKHVSFPPLRRSAACCPRSGRAAAKPSGLFQ